MAKKTTSAKKKADSNRGSRMGANAPKSVEEYFSRVPEPARSTLEKVRAVIRSVVPTETIEVISYGMPTFKHTRAIVGIAAFSDHCSLFPMGSSVLDSMEDELKEFRASKGTLHFPVDKPMPSALIKKIVKARVAQNEMQQKRVGS